MAITHVLSATTPDDPAYEIRPSHWNSGHNQQITIVGNTAGASTISGTNIVFSAGPNATISVNGDTLVWSGGAGGAGNTGYLSAGTTYASLGTVSFSNLNGLAFGVNGQTITGSYTVPTQSNQTVGGYFVGNTTGQSSSSTVDARSISVDGAGIVSAGWSNGTIRISATQSNQAFSADASSTFQTLTFQNSNLVSFSNNAGAIRVTHDLMASSSRPAFSADASSTFQTLTLQNSNGISFSNNAGAVRITHDLAFSSQTNLTGRIYVTAQSTGQSSSSTYDLRTLSIVPDGIISAGWSNGSFRISATVAAQTNQTLGIYASSNTTGASSSSTYDARSLTIVGSDNISVGWTNGSFIIKGAAGGAAGSQSVGMSTQTAGGATAGTTGYASGSAIQYLLVPGSNITMSQSVNGVSGTMSIYAPSPGAAAENNWFTLAGDNTAGNTTASGSSIMISVQGPLTISGTNNSQIKISAPATSSLVGTDGIGVTTNGSTISIGLSPKEYTASFFEPEVFGSSSYTTETNANGTVYFRPFYLNNYLNVARAHILHQVTSQSATTMSFSASVSSQTSSSGSGSFGLSGTLLFFSRVSTGTAANSSQIISFKSNTYSLSQGYSMSVSWSTNASSATGSWTTSAAFGFISSVGSNGAVTTGSTATSGSSTFTSTSTNQNSFSSSAVMSFMSQHVSQIRPVMIGVGTTLSPGEYWLAHIQSTATASGTYSMQRLCRPNSFGVLHYVSQTSGYMELGNSASMESSGYKWGIGSYSASSQTTTTIPISQISNRSNQSLYFYLLGQVK